MKKISCMVFILGLVFFRNPIFVGGIEVTNERDFARTELMTLLESEEIVIEEVETPTYRIPVTDAEYDLMARVVMSESSTLSIDGKQAVASTIVNRVLDGRWGNTVTEVINYPNAYSTSDNGEPNAECYYAVDSALLYAGFPEDMFYFSSGRSHSFGNVYAIIGNTYFVTESKYE